MATSTTTPVTNTDVSFVVDLADAATGKTAWRGIYNGEAQKSAPSDSRLNSLATSDLQHAAEGSGVMRRGGELGLASVLLASCVSGGSGVSFERNEAVPIPSGATVSFRGDASEGSGQVHPDVANDSFAGWNHICFSSASIEVSGLSAAR